MFELITQLYALILFGGLTFLAGIIGYSLLKRSLFPHFDSATEKVVFSNLLGAVVVVYGTYLLGSLHLLYLSLFIPFFLAIFFLLRAFWKPYFLLLKESLTESFSFREIRDFESILSILSLLLLMICLLSCLAPPKDIDSLAYHLAHPKTFVSRHFIGPIPLTSGSLWPFFAEMFYTLSLLFRNERSAHLFHGWAYLLTALALFSIGQKWFSRRVGKIASLVFLATPIAFYESSIAYADLWLGLFMLLSIYTAIMAIEAPFKNGWAILSGVSIGGAMSCKYLGLQAPLVVLSLGILALFLKKLSFLSLLRRGLVLILPAALIGLPWYIRSWINLGNPVFPFASSIFGSGFPADIAERVGSMGQWSIKAFLLAFWNLTMNPDQFSGGQVGPLLAAFFPLSLFFVLRRKAPSHSFFLFSALALLYLLWFSTAQVLRFFLTLVPILALFCGLAVNRFLEISSPAWKRFFHFSFFLLLGMNLSIIGLYAARTLPPVLHFQREEEFLARYDYTYELAKKVSHALPQGSVLLSVGMPGKYRFEHDFVLEIAMRRYERYQDRVKSWEEMIRYLRTKHGVTHVLIQEPLSSDDPESFEFANLRQGAPEIFARSFSKILSHTFVGSSGKKHFALFRLNE